MDQDSFIAAALQNPANETIARELTELALPDAWIVAGCRQLRSQGCAMEASLAGTHDSWS